MKQLNMNKNYMMKKTLLIFLMLLMTAAINAQFQVVGVGASANDATGDPLRTFGQKMNANWSMMQDTLDAALDADLYYWLKTDTGYTHKQLITYDQLMNYTGGGSGGSGKYMLQFTVGSTPGAPANGDTTMTVSALANMHIDLFRGTTADLHRQDLNRTATNGKTGYRFNSSGTVVVRPAWATGDRAIIEAVPVAGVSWITLGSTGASAYMTETFEGAGYANPIWAETVGSGSTVDEDEAGITPPNGGGSQTLQITKVSPNFNAASIGTLAADQVISYTTFYVYVNEHGLASTDYVQFVSFWQDGYSAGIAAVNLYVDSYDSNRLKFVCEVNEDGTGTRSVAWPGSGSSVALDTWYKFNIKYDITNDAYEVKVTPAGGSEVTVMTGSLTDTHPTTGLRLIKLGNTSDSKTWDIYFDNVAVGTTAYPTF